MTGFLLYLLLPFLCLSAFLSLHSPSLLLLHPLLSAPSVSPLSPDLLLSPHLYTLPCLGVLEVLPERDGEWPAVGPELYAGMGREQGRGRGSDRIASGCGIFSGLSSLHSPSLGTIGSKHSGLDDGGRPRALLLCSTRGGGEGARRADG